MTSPAEDGLTQRVIGLAIQVHRELGPGFLESIYEEAMAVALRDAGLEFKRQAAISVFFRGRAVGEHRADLIVANEVVVELKAIKTFEDVHFAIVRSYLHAFGCRCGLLLNFASTTLQVKRIGAEFRVLK